MNSTIHGRNRQHQPAKQAAERRVSAGCNTQQGSSVRCYL